MSDWALGAMHALGYLGLALVMVAENIFPPIPSEAVLPLAGFLVGAGRMSFWGAVTAATAGAYAGALVLYALGRWGGRPLVLRYGRVLRIDEKGLEQAEGWFERYGDWVVLFARVVPLVRSVVSVPAGIMRMPLGRFSVFTLVGSAFWNACLIWAGAYSDAVVVLLGAAALACGAYLILHRRAGGRGR